MSLSYSNYTPPFNTSTAGLKSQPGLKFLHVTSPLLQILQNVRFIYAKFLLCSQKLFDSVNQGLGY